MAEPRIQQNYEIPVTGSVSGSSANTIGTSAAAVLAGDGNRRKVTFHNPNYDSTGGTDLLLAQSASPSFAAPGGGFILLPAATMVFEGDLAQGPWYATARAGSNLGVTVAVSSK